MLKKSDAVYRTVMELFQEWDIKRVEDLEFPLPEGWHELIGGKGNIIISVCWNENDYEYISFIIISDTDIVKDDVPLKDLKKKIISQLVMMI